MYLGNEPKLTIRIDFVFVATQGQTIFTGIDNNSLTLSYDPNNYDVFANGILLARDEFVGTNGSSITFVSQRNLGDIITIRSYGVPDNIDGLLVNKVNVSDSGYLTGYRNKIINGDFGIWQRATSQTSNGYGSDDRWLNANVGSTKIASRQSFSLGQTDVPGNPKFYARTQVTSSAGASNYVRKTQRIEGVETLSNQTATLTFYARADSARNIAIDLNQSFGTGGSPSTDVSAIGAQLVALTSSWKRFDIIVNIPSVSGKVLGSDENDYLSINFWFDAGTDFATRSSNLGQQSGTFDIAHVSLVQGNAMAITDPFSPRHIQQELNICQRYYELVTLAPGTLVLSPLGGPSHSGTVYATLWYKAVKRTLPIINTGGFTNVSSPSTTVTPDCVRFGGSASSTGTTIAGPITIDAEI